MEGIRDLLRLLTDMFPPRVGTRHAITVADGYDDVADMPEINLVLTLSTNSGFLPIYLPDEDLTLTGQELFTEIMKVLEEHGLIDNSEQ